jgi:hypothetical protein
MTISQPANPKCKLRWYQFSLRSLMIFVTLFAVICSWFTMQYQRATRRLHAYEILLNEFYTTCGGESPWYSSWLHKLFGDEDCYSVTTMVFSGQSYISDIEMKLIGQFEELNQLWFDEHNSITDVGLKHIENLTQLDDLSLPCTKMTDNGLLHLRNMKQLQKLSISGTNITDTGLEYIKCLKNLKTVNLSNTNVTDPGIQKLKKELPDLKIIR